MSSLEITLAQAWQIGITMQDGQQLLGATTLHKVATSAGNVTITPQASGNFLPLIANGSGVVVTLANNNVVSGFYIQNLNANGVYGEWCYQSDHYPEHYAGH